MKAIIKNNNNAYVPQNMRYSMGAKLKQNELNDLEYKKINKNKNINNTIRPTQAISFGGSLNSKTVRNIANAVQDSAFGKTIGKATEAVDNKIYPKFIKSKFINGMVDFTANNEAAFTAIYSLIFAGIIKPICVLNQKGSDEKDKQYIATKNFLQAFLGSFLSLTVGGGIMKKVTDTITNNLKLMKIGDKNNIELVDRNSKEAVSVAKKALNKQYSSLGSRINLAKETTKDLSGIKKATQFIKDTRKKVSIDYDNNAIIRTFKENGKEAVENISGHDIAKELSKKGDAVYDIAKSHLKIFDKHSDYVAKLLDALKDTKSRNTLYDSFESVLKNSTGWITAIMKAKISSALLPSVVAFMFADGALKGTKKAKENAAKKQQAKNSSMLLNSKVFKKENDNYKALLNGKNDKKEQKNSQIPFKGNVISSVGNVFTKGVEHICLSKPAETFTKALIDIPSPFNKPSARMGDIESALITGYWVVNTLHSKKIEPSQKLGLNLHTILVTIVSSTCAFLIDTLLDGAINKAEGAYSNAIKEAYEKASKNAKDNPEEFSRIIKEGCEKLFNNSEIEKQINSTLKDTDSANDVIENLSRNYSKKLSKFKSLVIFTAVVRFLVPVLLVPFSGKLKKIIEEKREKKAKNEPASKVK